MHRYDDESGNYYYLLTPETDVDNCTMAIGLPDGWGPQTQTNNAWQELGNMSIENAHVIGLSVGLLWAGAYTFRLLARAIPDPIQNEGIQP